MEFHKDGTLPKNGEIFVFGSNLSGIHGAGAAKVANEQFGARLGIHFGHVGNSFAIPTKNQQIKTLPLNDIAMWIDRFNSFVMTNPQYKFFITRVGCGLAGYRDKDIAPLFIPNKNCSFAIEWKQFFVKGR